MVSSAHEDEETVPKRTLPIEYTNDVNSPPSHTKRTYSKDDLSLSTDEKIENDQTDDEQKREDIGRLAKEDPDDNNCTNSKAYQETDSSIHEERGQSWEANTKESSMVDDDTEHFVIDNNIVTSAHEEVVF